MKIEIRVGPLGCLPLRKDTTYLFEAGFQRGVSTLGPHNRRVSMRSSTLHNRPGPVVSLQHTRARPWPVI